MTAYANRFVVCVTVNGNVVKPNKAGVVEVPFGSEYAIRLHNKNHRRALAHIYLDGDNVSGNGYVIGANLEVEIERYADKPLKFVFVAEESARACAEGKSSNKNGANGLLRVTFYFEKYPPMQLCATPKNPWRSPPVYGGQYQNYSYDGVTVSSYSASAANNSCSFDGEEYTSRGLQSSAKSLENGCTVAGDYSKQDFNFVSFDPESEPAAELTLVMRGFRQDLVQMKKEQALAKLSEEDKKVLGL